MNITSNRLASFEEMKGKYPEIIYKYRNWSDEYNKNVLIKLELFYSPPSSFKDDPNDCKGAIRYDLLSKEDKIKFIEYKLREKFPDKARNYYRSESRIRYKTSPLSNIDKLEEYKKETYEDFDKRFGVLSLTANPKIIKMWEKYSNNHRGYCIGFHSEILFEQLGGGCKVFYDKELPIIYPTPIHSYEEQHIYQVYYKEKEWSYEEEYRTHTFNQNPLYNYDRIIKVNPKAFKEIILGAKLSSEEKNEIVNSIPSTLNHIQILEVEIINKKIEIKNFVK